MKVIRTELLLLGEEGIEPVLGNKKSIEFVVVLTNQRLKTGVQGLQNKEVLVIPRKELYS